MLEKFVAFVARLLAKSSGARRRLRRPEALAAAGVSGAAAGLLVVVVLLALPKSLTDLVTKPGWERLTTTMLFSGMVGGALAGPYLLFVNRLLRPVRGVRAGLLGTLLIMTSGGIMVAIHCLASWDAPWCKPNMEWVALGLSVGATTVLALTASDFWQPPAPVSFSWINARSALVGLLIYESTHAVSHFLKLDFGHERRGLVTFIGSTLFLVVSQIGLWLRAGGAVAALEALGDQG